MPSALPPPLRVAIIGGGPGGLGTAISLSSLPNVTVTLYEQARELREIGAGIRIGYNCWKVLELLGAADGVKGNVKDQILHRFVQNVSFCNGGTFNRVGWQGEGTTQKPEILLQSSSIHPLLTCPVHQHVLIQK